MDYRLPFDADTGWQLWNGNWDDPVAGHGDDPFPATSQAYSFDFGHKNSAKGRNIRAARAGTVLLVRNDLTENVWQWTEQQVADYLAAHPGLTIQALGSGSHVLIKHEDNSVAAYCHLKPNQTFVTKPGQAIKRGQVIGLADKTGNASTDHLHFDVRTFWNGYTDLGPTITVRFEDANHKCWRPRAGDLLSSNNS